MKNVQEQSVQRAFSYLSFLLPGPFLVRIKYSVRVLLPGDLKKVKGEIDLWIFFLSISSLLPEPATLNPNGNNTSVVVAAAAVAVAVVVAHPDGLTETD